jgi:hypothetical protein
MRRILLDLFVEDRGHEEFLKHLAERIARDVGCGLSLRPLSARGGHGRAIKEWRMYPRVLKETRAPFPDLVIVAIDANCKGWNQARGELLRAADPELRQRTVAACPDPHIERWYLADPESFVKVVGAAPREEARKCERDRYKGLLVEAIKRGGHTPTLRGIEFAQEIVAAMDLYRAGRREPSLRAFIDDLRKALRRLTSPRSIETEDGNA